MGQCGNTGGSGSHGWCFSNRGLLRRSKRSAEFCTSETLRLLRAVRANYNRTVSRLRRLVLADRYFFVTCNLERGRRLLSNEELSLLARAIALRRSAHRFLLTAWVLLPDHWHAIVYPAHPLTISETMEAIKVSATRRINRGRGTLGPLFQSRFFDRALRTVKEYGETVEYIHWNPVRRG